MKCGCGHNHIQVYSKEKAIRLDPTKTTTIRARFLAEMNRRFKLLKKQITEAIVDQDCFGLVTSQHSLSLNVEPRQFAFPRNQDKVKSFMAWLKKMEEAGILTVSTKPGRIGQAVEVAWTDMYIDSAYKQGIRNALADMKKGGVDIGIASGELNADPVQIQFNLPVHADRVGLMYTRSFSELKGITDVMDQQISSILSQGLLEGRYPLLIAKQLNDRVGVSLSKARTLARTEVIRAHHLGSIQEYRNAGLLGVTIQSEWSTAGWNVCPKCAPMDGKVFSLDKIEGMIPYHPNCFIDGQIPIYTLDGWKPIREVAVGDMVLTHRGRFRKVIELHRNHTEVGQDIIKLGTRNWWGSWTKISVTSNHPIFTQRGWIEAGKLEPTDELSILSGECKQCGKQIPWAKSFCSSSCASTHTATNQWKSQEHRENIQRKNRASMLHQYESGIRDRFEITKEANKVTRRDVLLGVHPLQDAENHRKSNQRLGELHSSGGTWIEKKLYWALQKFGLSPVIGFSIPIRSRSRRKTYLFPDFAFPDHGVLVEADGIAWHDPEKDAIRDQKLTARGWDVLRFTEKEILTNVLECAWKVRRYILNHSGSYSFLSVPATFLEKYQTKRKQPTYNFSVEEDESYIAHGWIVHNCRCAAKPYIPGISPKREEFKGE